MRRRELFSNEEIPDILEVKVRISMGSIVEDGILTFDMNTKKAVATMNPIMDHGGTITWAVLDFPSWAKSIEFQYGVWTISNGSVWTKYQIMTDVGSWTGSGTSLNLVNANMSIKTVNM